MGAVLQFEIDRRRWNRLSIPGETSEGALSRLASGAAIDTIKHGGTFVLVATPDKITMVQRPEADAYEDDAALSKVQP